MASDEIHKWARHVSRYRYVHIGSQRYLFRDTDTCREYSYSIIWFGFQLLLALLFHFDGMSWKYLANSFHFISWVENYFRKWDIFSFSLKVRLNCWMDVGNLCCFRLIYLKCCMKIPYCLVEKPIQALH